MRWLVCTSLVWLGCGSVLPVAPSDTDRDGVLDAVDACPREPEDADGVRDADGCAEPDNDADGVLDVVDRCPCFAEDADHFEDEDGCPDPDNDNDRIVDVCDACPSEVEIYNGLDDEDGCPEQTCRGMLSAEDIVVIQRACFARNRSEIEGDAARVAEATATVIRSFPRLQSLAIIGHATPRERSPDALALRRAEAFRDRLVALEVRAEVLVVESAGSSRPLNPNLESQENRCVQTEVRVMEEDPSSATPPVLCPAGTHIPEAVDACAAEASKSR